MGNTNQASGATGKTTCAGINSHPSYIGVMNREKAEVMLRKKGGNHCFIRYCKEDHAYMISGIKDGVDITHIKITVDQDNLYILEGREEKFDFVSDLLVKYYEEEFDFGGMMGTPTPLRFEAAPTRQLEEIANHPSYHGAITWEQAEIKLKEHGGNCYLTRYTTGRKVYVLSVMNDGIQGKEPIIRHFNLIIGDKDENTCEIQGAKKQFSNIFDLLNFYRTTPVDHAIRTIGDCLRATHTQSSMDYNPIPLPPRSPSPYMGYPSEVHNDLEAQNSKKHGASAIKGIGSYKKSLIEACSIFSNVLVHLEKIAKDVPSLYNLTLLKWMDKHGNRQHLRLIEELSPQWETVGIMLGIGSPKLDNLRSSRADNVSSCRSVFKDWIANEGHPEYPVSWDSICELLNDVQKGEVAKKLKEALDCLEVTTYP